MTDQPDTEERPMARSIWRGLRTRCPRCGEGRILHDYLKLRTECPVCDLDLSRVRADDGPAYLTILLVGHLLVVPLHVYFVEVRPDPLHLFAVFGGLALVLSLFLLPRFKGAMVGWMWAGRNEAFV
ncbi:uncharacterized protein (DUF983 family) [Hasllibacter halocynthiae]|uniref:Uncharacterized protein (DUF983 family) n=1 Tax=Hasllibacter halocynthiae TaxID=595589 RepID=A0A2T0X6S6_9RHOB|nr:DUF983 domain-containing protein [Hasllibacter halocynthiae]PRY94639.1 uncharacterized protein (DUF983 family) [Hasllibacter halocynthiae]